MSLKKIDMYVSLLKLVHGRYPILNNKTLLILTSTIFAQQDFSVVGGIASGALKTILGIYLTSVVVVENITIYTEYMRKKAIKRKLELFMGK